MNQSQDLQALLAELRARMTNLRPDNIEATMRLAGLLRSTVADAAIGEELAGHLKTLGRQYRAWKRAKALS